MSVTILFVGPIRQRGALKILNKNFEFWKNENTILKEGFFHTYDLLAESLDFQTIIFNYENKPTTIEQVLKDKTSLVLLVDIKSCGPCVVDNIQRIIDKSTTKTHNVFIGIKGYDTRSFRAYAVNNKIENIAYRIPDDIIYFDKFPIIYFVVKEGLRANYFFGPPQQMPELTDMYYDQLKVRFGI